MSMKTKLIMGVVTIATFAISLNLYSSDEKMGVNAPRTQVLRGGNVYCAFNLWGRLPENSMSIIILSF